MRQLLPLEAKVAMTKVRIREWVNEFGIDGVYVSFSGGKDSTVLLNIAREMYPDIKAVFVDTGLEYPEIREFVKTFDNVDWLRPQKNFKKVIEDYGYPIISKDISQCIHDIRIQAGKNNCCRRETHLWDIKMNPNSEHAKRYPQYSRARYDYLNDAPFKISHMCCGVMKKNPSKAYEKQTGRKPILATMACESRLRTTVWLNEGCNAFEVKRPISKPISFWVEQDIYRYIKEHDIKICSIYGEVVPDYKGEQLEGQMDFCDLGLAEDNRKFKLTGLDRTGCMFCLYGCHLDKSPNRLERMKETHPKQYEFIMRPKEQGGLGYKEVIDWINEHGNIHINY